MLICCTRDADRDNPLDPRSGKYENFGSVAGYVYSYYAPFQPLISALVALMPGDRTTITNSKGEFHFTNIVPGNYRVISNYPGYASDTAQVEVHPNRIATVQLHLDGLPGLDTLVLNSGYQHEHYPFEPVRMIDLTATVTDPDGPADVASVAVIIPVINFKDTLGFSNAIGVFQQKIDERELPIKNIAELVGHPFYIEVTDKVGQKCLYGPKYLFRVIDEEPVVVSPKGSVTVGFQPTLKWGPVQLPFPFTFKVEIYAIREGQILYPAMYSFSKLSSETTELRLATVLQSSLYLWVVSIVDQWGNWSRSKPATFQVGG
ncbi:MAG: carboxypeptidase-like regulatory domain-containing protein [candidate division KSB1 bacterium]|nr:carboxypeptidase-like regulatory domain-containing protein [candidate division KSB1 bacterium]MDZ7334385.1 carboxypeptidase-like regulatory domain-containing protein [candidate division KSB1 bacterium]MDZ7358265.1 carboxypeptidase-like regulatory domain-containing protein [candidate division KSB1 bacterium]MDZ7398808.1 carboxypeptidase-like regulatory domain-containing protein [candidate division KSB1 bacterium]